MRWLAGCPLVSSFVMAMMTIAVPAAAQLQTRSGTSGPGPVETTADQVTGRINPTGRVLPMSVPLVDNGRKLGEVLIRIGVDDRITVSRTQLVAVLKGEASAQVLDQLSTLPDMVAFGELVEAGLNVSLDRLRMELVLGMSAAQRRGGDISLAAPAAPAAIGSSVLARPATVSGYVNLFADAGYLWNRDETALRLDIEPVLRLYGLVVESEFTWQNKVDPFLCPGCDLAGPFR